MKPARRPGQPEPSRAYRPKAGVARRHFATLAKLKKFTAEPTCLRCGYDLRGLATAGRRTCPECGLACGLRDVVSQIERLRMQHNPVYKEVALGITILACSLPTAALLGLPIGFVLAHALLAVSVSSHYVDISLWIPPAVLALVCWGTWLCSPVLAWRVMNGPRGLAMWGLFHALLVLLVPGVVAVVTWAMIVFIELAGRALEGLGLIDGYQSLELDWPIELRPDGWPSHAAALGGVVLLAVLAQLNRHYIHLPCRRRLGQVASEQLADSEAFATTADHPAASAADKPTA